MTSNRITALEDRLATATAGDLAVVAYEGLATAWPQTESTPEFDPDLTISLDKALGLIVQTLPNWAVALEGTAHASVGHWSCTLRESGRRDDVEEIGIGRAATAPLAMIVALLRVLISRGKGLG